MNDMVARLRQACGSAPSAGHDVADEVIGQLRVARQQRDDAEREVRALQREREELRAALRGVRLLWRDHIRHAGCCPLSAIPVPTGPCNCVVGRAADQADRVLREGGRR